MKVTLRSAMVLVGALWNGLSACGGANERGADAQPQSDGETPMNGHDASPPSDAGGHTIGEGGPSQASYIEIQGREPVSMPAARCGPKFSGNGFAVSTASSEARVHVVISFSAAPPPGTYPAIWFYSGDLDESNCYMELGVAPEGETMRRPYDSQGTGGSVEHRSRDGVHEFVLSDVITVREEMGILKSLVVSGTILCESFETE